MGRYAVVANQTASSPELLDKLKDLARDDPEAEFILVVPATPVRHLLAGETEGEAHEIARRAGEAAWKLFDQNGLKVKRVAVGDEVPVRAVEDDLRDHPEAYEAIIVCTLPLGISRWLGVDILHQMRRRFEIPVIHVPVEAKSTTRAER